ncbi:cathelicidin-6-like [Dromiciops gliroides]|uniref:cathelicidin-6-like n=1 Tax=Dromiciops gliroides TaxID=33562 RepID=UPI001CC39D52|nr:cathelicidin-6-like [Dromiciops gliroides]
MEGMPFQPRTGPGPRSYIPFPLPASIPSSPNLSFQLLSFTLKETMYPVTEGTPLDQCDFKTDGLVKECQGSIWLPSSSPVTQRPQRNIILRGAPQASTDYPKGP